MSCAVEPVCAGGCLFLGPRGARGGSETFPRGSEGKAHCPRDLETEGWASNSLPEGLDPAALPDSALGSCQVNGAIGTAPSPPPQEMMGFYMWSQLNNLRKMNGVVSSFQCRKLGLQKAN